MQDAGYVIVIVRAMDTREEPSGSYCRSRDWSGSNDLYLIL